jgi:hypothetical protein
VPELGSLGSVRGALSDGRPYREHPGDHPHTLLPLPRTVGRPKEQPWLHTTRKRGNVA